MRRLVLVLFVLALAAAAWLAYALYFPAGPPGEKFVLLRPGSSARRIAAQLQEEGVIRNRYAFLLWHAWTGDKPLRAGEYRFDGAASAVSVHGRVIGGDVYYHVVTIPEGYNIFDVARAMSASGLGSETEFLRILRNPLPIHELDPHALSLEGYCFPDTYQFTRTEEPAEMVGKMVRRFREEGRTLGLIAPDGQAATPDLHRIVTMASIVEKETAAPAERPEVASVYYNRLERHMALGADPTVIYAALLQGRYRGTIYQSDLASESPFNTYKHPGLPPGPIANPGRASLQAALHPAGTDYLYFVSDNNGHHRFARTALEHERNVALYRRAVQNR